MAACGPWHWLPPGRRALEPNPFRACMPRLTYPVGPSSGSRDCCVSVWPHPHHLCRPRKEQELNLGCHAVGLPHWAVCRCALVGHDRMTYWFMGCVRQPTREALQLTRLHSCPTWQQQAAMCNEGYQHFLFVSNTVTLSSFLGLSATP